MEIDDRPLKKRCQAMIDEGIEDVDSLEGIDFCTGSCPYDHCLPMETREEGAAAKRQIRAEIVWKLRDGGYSVEDIAIKMRLPQRTIRSIMKL